MEVCTRRVFDLVSFTVRLFYPIPYSSDNLPVSSIFLSSLFWVV